MLLKVGAVSRSGGVVGSIPPTSRHSSTSEFPCFHAHIPNLSCPSYPARKPKFRALGIPRLGSGIVGSGKDGCLKGFAAEFDVEEEEEEFSVGGEIYRSTLRLVECSVFAALSGYFVHEMGHFCWEENHGRDSRSITRPLWSVESADLSAYAWYSWISNGHFVEVPALCAMGYAMISSFLIRENILDLITINLHALLACLFVSLGVNSVPSMGVVYAIFRFVLLLNSVFLVFLLHLLY